MKHPLIALGLLAMPAMAFALDFSNGSSMYADSATFVREERAGISVLTNLGAVSGNPDGTFAPRRTLNRAEFLKIVLKSSPGMDIIDSDKAACFPDVKANDWFSIYVCAAKRTGIVSGYPDGTFKPGNAVNYAEAIKMLTELYDYELPTPGMTERWAWYTAYLRAATDRGVLLGGDLPMETLLTRGQMARLAAAYRADHDGELHLYRQLEAGTYSSSSSSRTSASSSSSVSSVSSSGSSVSSSSSSSVSSSSAASSSSVTVYPAVSRFLMSGEKTPVIMDGLYMYQDEDAVLRRATVLLRREIKSFDSLILVDEAGKEIVTLTLATSNNTDNRRFEAIVVDDRLRLVKNKPTRLGYKAVLKTRENGGVSNELVEVENAFIEVQSTETNVSRQIVPTDTHYPMHQTTQARVTAVRNVMSPGSIQAGSDKQIASFSISGKSVSGATLSIANIEFILQKTNVSATHIRIGGSSAVEQADCGLEQAEILRITCPVIPDSFKTIGTTPRVISIYADVAVGDAGNTGSLQLLFEGRGKIGQNGAIRWSDGTASYNWVEPETTLENGPMWTVSK